MAQDGQWRLSRQSLELLLARLDADPSRAAELYEELRSKIIKFFEWRRSYEPEELTDETLDRLARKVEEGSVKDSVSSYAYGIARMVLLEQQRKRERRQAVLDQLPPPAPPTPEERERPELECFDHCISRLAPDSRKLILEYYQQERIAKIELRKSLADRLKIPLTALRLRAHRIRGSLETCVTGCLSGKIS